MAIKDLLEEIDVNVKDVVETKFEYYSSTSVPNLEDAGLTYESGVEKKGKLIDTCVLFVDIRDSVALTERHHNQTMGRIYTAFTKAILKAAKHHNGHVRNIIGDRVMIVFDPEDCFTNAVDCAISINHIASKIIATRFKDVDFKCGIGIDNGKLRVTKVGIERKGTENAENKGLVWVGYPANLASRLTDNANKTIIDTYYEVVRNPINPQSIRPLFGLGMPLSPLFGKSTYDPKAPPYILSREETKKMSPEEFANNMRSHTDGELYMVGGNFIRFSKKDEPFTFSPILMTEDVYKGFKSANPNRESIKKGHWTEQKHSIKNVKSKVYGGNITWDV